MNLAYHRLTDGLTAPKRAEIDLALAPPERKEVLLAKQNQAAMEQLNRIMPMPPPPPRRKKQEG